ASRPPSPGQTASAQQGGNLHVSVLRGARRRVRHLDGLSLRWNPHDPPGESAAFEGPDQPAAGIDVVTPKSVERRGGKRMVVVVPGLAEGQPGKPPDVA